MKKYAEMTREELLKERERLSKEYEDFKALGLRLNMARGKPSAGQLLLSKKLLDVLGSDSVLLSEDGSDCGNYGDAFGIPEARKLMSQIMGVDPENVIIGGNSSLNIMFDSVCRGFTHGVLGSTPWHKLPKIKWIAVVPGYDRHFGVTERFGIEMISVPMLCDGPDMDMVEKLVSSDDAIKGMWCVPMYSNPTGNTYSDETVRRLAGLCPAAPDFRIYWDMAYTVHHLYEDRKDTLLNILSECEAAGNPDIVYCFASTSKITFAGGGISAVAASEANLEEIRKAIDVETIGYDKLNQLRHARYFKDIRGVEKHMEEFARLLRPKFEACERIFEEELSGPQVGTWTRPNGGYFISFDALPGTAGKIVALCKEAGVVLTGAGATYPYGKDPADSNIRIAPTFPEQEEIETAMKIFTVCVRIASVDTLL